MNGFALLWSKILDSSVWVKGSKETRLVWITLLAMKDSKGEIYASVVGLANRARVTDEECKKSLSVLLSPDQDDTSGVEDGRRLRVIPGGWQIVNHDLYRFSTEAKREFWRTQKAEQRAKAEQPKKPRRERAPKGTERPSGKSDSNYIRILEESGQAAADEYLDRRNKIESI